MTEQVILHGGGDHARVVLDSLLAQGREVVGIFDPRLKGHLFNVPMLGPYQPTALPDSSLIIAIGDNQVRKKVASASAHAFATVIDRTAVVSGRAMIGEGSMVLQRSVVQAQSLIGKHVIVNTAAQVDHDCEIGDFVHIGPGSVLCGTVRVGEGTFIGAGSVVIPGITIGEWSVIGAGSVVVRDIPAYSLAVGSPARVIKNLKS